MPKPSEIVVSIARELIEKEDEQMEKEAASNPEAKAAHEFLHGDLYKNASEAEKAQLQNMRIHEKLLPALLIYLDNKEEFDKKG